MSQINIVREFAIPAQRVFDGLANQDTMGRWMGGKISVAVRGANGLVGTVRRIHLGTRHFDERIVAVEPGRSIAYEICSPMPALKHHRGEISVEPIGSAGCRVTWNIVMDFSPAFLGPFVLGGVRLVVSRGLTTLSRQLARA